MRLPSTIIFVAGCLVSAGCSPRGDAVIADLLKLQDGSNTPRLVLQNDQVRVVFLPEIGGKIVSLKDCNGREYLSRSTRPYTRRTFGVDYGKTEFDGIDECFPSLGKCTYPAKPYDDVTVVDHGETCQVAWKHIPGPGVILEAKGVKLPYTFRREATLEGSTLVLNYTVTNTAPAPLHYVYVFHPLFAGETGCRLEIPDTMPVNISWNRKGFLGKRGTVVAWAKLKDEQGRAFKEHQFTAGTGRYYKYYSNLLKKGKAILRYRDGSGVVLNWPAESMPVYAVWCSEGSIGGLHHIAPEPATGMIDSLADAYKAGKARTIPAHSKVTWWIRLSVVPAKPKSGALREGTSQQQSRYYSRLLGRRLNSVGDIPVSRLNVLEK